MDQETKYLIIMAIFFWMLGPTIIVGPPLVQNAFSYTFPLSVNYGLVPGGTKTVISSTPSQTYNLSNGGTVTMGAGVRTVTSTSRQFINGQEVTLNADQPIQFCLFPIFFGGWRNILQKIFGLAASILFFYIFYYRLVKAWF